MKIPLKEYLELLQTYLRPQWHRVLLLVLLLLGGIGLQLWTPLLLRSFIDTATGGGPLATLIQIALVYVIAALVQQGLQAYSGYLGEDLSWTATNELRVRLAEHCLRLDMGFHKAHNPGQMIERIDGDVTGLSAFFSQLIIGIASNLVLVVGVVLLLFREDWRVGIAMALFASLAVFAMLRVRSIAVPYMAAVRQSSALFYGFLGEQLNGLEDIRSNGATAHVMRRFYEPLKAWLDNDRKAGLGMAAIWVTTILTFAVGHALSLGLGGYLFYQGAITLGTVHLIFNYTELIRRPIEQVRTQLQELQKASASIIRVRDLLNRTAAVKDGTGRSIPAGPLSVEFDHLTFGYADANSGELVLSDLSFRLEPGKVMGLLGRTGSGKTTTARLLLRFYDATSGEIRLGGIPVKEAPIANLRARVGIVTQDVQLFHATVRENLTFFDTSIPDAQIWAALEDLGLTEWVQALPKGLDTELEGSSGLSAGEAQLLAFGRLFLADPGLVILDEASSRLDPATERLIERAVSRLLEGRTGIIIAHRLGTIQRADQIMILEDGRILEQGDRERLAADPSSRFHRLLQTGLEEVLV